MKKIIIAAAVLLGGISAEAQQIAMNSQYIVNELSINPAVAGSTPYIPIGFSFRRQWSGIDQAPVTQSLWAHGYMGAGFGVGVNIYNDVAGPTRRTGIAPSLAYHLRLNDELILSFGAGASVTQFYMDRDKMVTEVAGDNAVMMNTNNQLVPDANAGLWLSTERLFVGVSGWHLIESKSDLFDIESTVTNTLDRTFYGMAGYKIPVGDKFDITPSALFRFMTNAPFALDANLIATYNDQIWLGGSFRLNDAVAAMLGVKVGSVRFGYSYDFTLSDLSNYSNGTHELFLGLGIRSNNSNRVPWKQRNRVFSSFSR